MLKSGEVYCSLCKDPTSEKDGICLHCLKKIAIKAEEYYHKYASRSYSKRDYDFCLDSLSERFGRKDSILDIIRRYKSKELPRRPI